MGVLQSKSKALRLKAGLPLYMWPDCVRHSAYLINRTPARALNGEIPEEPLVVYLFLLFAPVLFVVGLR